jgi:hypothetical protein
MADGNSIFTNMLASVLGGAIGAVAGGAIATKIRQRGPKEAPFAELVPLFGKGHYYTATFSGGRIMWLDDLCYLALLASVSEARELVGGGGYGLRFPNQVSAYLRVTSLAAPRQVGRLFEVKGSEAVSTVRERCAILEKNEEAEEVAVRMVGTTIGEYYNRQVEAVTGRRGGGR